MKIDHNVQAHQNRPMEHGRSAAESSKEQQQAEPSTVVQISDEARQRQKTTTSEGKNAASPAWQAREMMEQYEELRGMRFGQLVSSIARGEDPVQQWVQESPEHTGASETDPLVTPPPATADGSPVADAVETGASTAPADGADGRVVADLPGIDAGEDPPQITDPIEAILDDPQRQENS